MSAVTECGSSLFEELINGEGGGKNTVCLSEQEIMLRQRCLIFSCGLVFLCVLVWVFFVFVLFSE